MLGKRTKTKGGDGEIIPHNFAKDIVGATLAVALNLSSQGLHRTVETLSVLHPNFRAEYRYVGGDRKGRPYNVDMKTAGRLPGCWVYLLR